MPNDLYTGLYNPDVLSCLANLSNDEVFTPPEVANAMLDLLPQELFESPDTKFLDPACKSGVFLREIAKRLLRGQITDYDQRITEISDKKRRNEPLTSEDAAFLEVLQQRLDHIFHEQLYGIAITELTSLLSRRSIYCSKYPNGAYSVSKFENAEGNIRFRRTPHTWGKTTYDAKGNPHANCVFCGASKERYDREIGLETHAYEFIHTIKLQELFNMKFDVIIGNPPYQLNTGTTSAQAIPLYHRFVQQAKKLQPRYLSMIIQSRWFAGGMKQLEDFRNEMRADKHLRVLVDYANAKDCFPQNSISGGVCYFLWDRENAGVCRITNINGNTTNHTERYLDEFPVVVRYNNAVDIVRKTTKEESLAGTVSSISPFGFSTKIRGISVKDRQHSVRLYASDGISYLSEKDIIKGQEYYG